MAHLKKMSSLAQSPLCSSTNLWGVLILMTIFGAITQCRESKKKMVALFYVVRCRHSTDQCLHTLER